MREFDHADASLLAKPRRLLKVETSGEVDAPPAEIWKIISDHQTWPAWHEDYEEHEALTERSHGMGATFRSREWWKLRSESEITRWDDGRAVGITLRRANFWRWLISSSYNEIEIEPDSENDQKSVVHYRAAFTGTIWFWLLSAYSVGHALISVYIAGSSSIKNLNRLATGS